MSYYFFLSHARLDRDSYLKKFYKDLTNTVRRLKGLSDENIGFFDEESIEPGQNWPENLAHALQNTRVFVSVFSRTYFTREHCGKEWRVFSSRLDEYSRGLTTRPPLILPVLWVPEDWLPKPLPSVVSEIQYKHSDFGDLYAKEGLRQFMALRRHRDSYKIFLRMFADKLIRAGDSYLVQPLDNLQPLQQIRSAWEQERTLVPGFHAAKPIPSAMDSGPLASLQEHVLDKVSGAQELLGLVQAFMVAGASSVIASLWPVSDIASADFMGALYKYLSEGLDKADALNKAQRDLAKIPAYAAPFFWSAFELYGDWRVTH